jgi:hypothetical protein
MPLAEIRTVNFRNAILVRYQCAEELGEYLKLYLRSLTCFYALVIKHRDSFMFPHTYKR